MKKSFLSHTMELTFHFQNSGLANPSVQIPPNEAHLWTCRDGSVILLSLLSAGLSLQLKGLQLSHSGKGPVHPHHLSKYIVEGEFDFFFFKKKKIIYAENKCQTYHDDDSIKKKRNRENQRYEHALGIKVLEV